MPDEESINSEFETALRSLQPQSIHLDAAEAAFTAGKYTARHRVRLWQGTTALFLLTTLGSLLLPWTRTAPSSSPQFVQAVTPHSQAGAQPLSNQSLIRLQQAVDQQGLAGLPTTHIPPATPLRLDGL